MMRSMPVEPHAPTVHLVEDDEPMRKATARIEGLPDIVLRGAWNTAVTFLTKPLHVPAP
jgi:hypothetical protein